MTSFDLHTALQNTYPAPNFTYLKEVRDATGFDSCRSADALAIGMYRSCGRLIHGFELKVSRSDWQRELKDASKAESIMRYCHRWSLIVPNESIVREGELPPTWGLGVPHQTRSNAAPKIKWIVKPPELNPIAPSMVFLSALIYAVGKVDEPARKKALEVEREEGRKDGIREEQRRTGDNAKLKEVVDIFEKASGVHLSQYTSETVATKLGLDFAKWRQLEGSAERYLTDLQRLREQAERITNSIRTALEPLEEDI